MTLESPFYGATVGHVYLPCHEKLARDRPIHGVPHVVQEGRAKSKQARHMAYTEYRRLCANGSETSATTPPMRCMKSMSLKYPLQNS